ncbi:YlaF family protein [Bacillus fonticola]|uniref:YlaF family protein n=1 Tax=Bacillus fonticola TaxID=2728853 RepID=UPI001473608A|nr:YlaF family protein [Bacillus fonticola]
MANIQWIFVLYSMVVAGALGAIGIALAERSILGMIVSFMIIILCMGAGFTTKKKQRERLQQKEVPAE